MTSATIALVTGATRGIGLETARQLAVRGVQVILGGRSREAAAACARAIRVEGLAADAVELDVTRPGDIAEVADRLDRQFGRLDVLVNNAGIFLDDPGLPPSQQSMETWRMTFETNLFATIATTNALLPLLKRSRAGRIVNVSSLLGSIALHQDPASPTFDFKVPAYCTAKTALNAWTVHLAHELRDTRIKVNAVHPGSVLTGMNSQGHMDVSEGARSSVEMALVGDDGPSGSFTHQGRVLPW